VLLQFQYTCGDVSSLGGDAKYNCVAYGGCDAPPFEQNCFEFNPQSANTPIDDKRDPAEYVPICCVSDSACTCIRRLLLLLLACHSSSCVRARMTVWVGVGYPHCMHTTSSVVSYDMGLLLTSLDWYLMRRTSVC
jgi:hypothetical protein